MAMLSITLFSDYRFSVLSWGNVDIIELEIDMRTESIRSNDFESYFS